MPSEKSATSKPERGRSFAPTTPGWWQGILAALVTAGLMGGWALPQLQPSAAEVGGRPAMTEIAEADLPGAENTLAGSPSDRARVKQADRVCGAHLAQVTLAPAKPGQTTRFRLQSGRYISPEFALTDAPLRIAIPYPAPYAAGRGAIGLTATGADVIVSLNPPWHAIPSPATVMQTVRWVPDPRCNGLAPS